MRVAGRVCWGKGTGQLPSTLTIPIPQMRVGGLPAKSMAGFPSEFELRSTMTDMVDLAFHYSHNILLDNKGGRTRQMVSSVSETFLLYVY